MISYRQFSSNVFNTIVILATLVLAPLSSNAVEIGSIKPSELLDRIRSDSAPLILDVRTPQEFSKGHIEGAINIPHTELSGRLSEITEDKSDEIVVHCRSGVRAGIAEKILTSAGYNQLKDLEGHILKWHALGYPLQKQ